MHPKVENQHKSARGKIVTLWRACGKKCACCFFLSCRGFFGINCARSGWLRAPLCNTKQSAEAQRHQVQTRSRPSQRFKKKKERKKEKFKIRWRGTVHPLHGKSGKRARRKQTPPSTFTEGGVSQRWGGEAFISPPTKTRSKRFICSHPAGLQEIVVSLDSVLILRPRRSHHTFLCF